MLFLFGSTGYENQYSKEGMGRVLSLADDEAGAVEKGPLDF